MENKKSIGIKIFACFIIISSVCVLWNVLGLAKSEGVVENLFTKPYAYLSTPFAILSTILFIILGINILRLKDWSRKSLISLAIICIVFNAAGFFLKNKEFKKFDKEGEAIMQKWTPQERQAAEHILDGYAVGTEFGSLAYFLLVAIFFTRPKIKEQFK